MEENFANVEARLDELSGAAFDAPEMHDDPRFQAEMRQRDTQALLGLNLAADEAAVVQAEQMGLVEPGAIARRERMEQAVGEAEAALEAQYPGWAKSPQRERVWATVVNTPQLLEEVAAAAGPSDVMRVVANVGAALQAQGAAHPQIDSVRMRMLAQSAVGAGGRALSPDAEAEWNAIRSAGQGSYADAMRGS
jgi:hypothetical protein